MLFQEVTQYICGKTMLIELFILHFDSRVCAKKILQILTRETFSSSEFNLVSYLIKRVCFCAKRLYQLFI